MILAIVRHGQTYYNLNGIVQGRVNIPLNETGKNQAKALAKLLLEKGEHFDVIAASPLSRSLETAYIIAKKLKYKKPIRVEPYFVERDFSELEGLPVEEAMPLTRVTGYTHEGYEDDQELIRRIRYAVLKLEKDIGDKRVLLVAHSHVIKALRIGIDPEKYHFTDLILNTDIFYFEVSDHEIKILNS